MLAIGALSPGTLKGTTSRSKPSSWAFLASVCERRAYSSCSTREIAKAAAKRSAECPIVSLVENSATAGSYKARHKVSTQYSCPTVVTGGLWNTHEQGLPFLGQDSTPRQTLPQAKWETWGWVQLSFYSSKSTQEIPEWIEVHNFHFGLGISSVLHRASLQSSQRWPEQQGYTQLSCDKFRGGGRNCFSFLSLSCLNSPHSEGYQSGSCPINQQATNSH